MNWTAFILGLIFCFTPCSGVQQVVDPTSTGDTIVVSFDLPSPVIRIGSSASERTVWTNEYNAQGIPTSMGWVGSGAYRVPTGNDDWIYTPSDTPGAPPVLNIDFGNVEDHNTILWQRANERAQKQTANEMDVLALSAEANSSFALANTLFSLYHGDSHDKLTKRFYGWVKFTTITLDWQQDRLEHRPVFGIFIAPDFLSTAMQWVFELNNQRYLFNSAMEGRNASERLRFGFNVPLPAPFRGINFIPQIHDLVPPSPNDNAVFEIPPCFFLSSKVDLRVVRGTRDSLQNVRSLSPLEDVEQYINDSEILRRFRFPGPDKDGNIPSDSRIPIRDRFNALRASIKKNQGKFEPIEKKRNELANQAIDMARNRTLDSATILENVKRIMEEHAQLETQTPNQAHLQRIYESFMSDVGNKTDKIVNCTDAEWDGHSQHVNLDDMRNYSHWGVWTDAGPMINATDDGHSHYVSGLDLDYIWTTSFPHLSSLTPMNHAAVKNLWNSLLKGLVTYPQFWENLCAYIPALQEQQDQPDASDTTTTTTDTTTTTTTAATTLPPESSTITVSATQGSARSTAARADPASAPAKRPAEVPAEKAPANKRGRKPKTTPPTPQPNPTTPAQALNEESLLQHLTGDSQNASDAIYPAGANPN